MPSIQESFANFVSALLRLLGLKKTDQQLRQAMLDDWDAKRRALADEVEGLKNDVGKTEDKLRAKSRELAATKGETRPIVEEEIKALLRELDLKKQKQNVLFGGIDRMNTLTERLKEVISAGKGTVAPEVIRQLQAEMGVVLMDLKDIDRETAKLSSMQYQRSSPEPQHYQARRTEAAGPTTTPTATTTPQGTPPVVPSRLSEAEQQRLSRIVEDTN
jgi:hypothetical protein